MLKMLDKCPTFPKSIGHRTTFSSLGLIKFFQNISIIFILLYDGSKGALAEPSKTYTMSSLCKNNFISKYRQIDGAELISKNEKNLDCTITFQTHSILQRFMLRFDKLKLDCNDHLYIFDSSHTAGGPKNDISCKHTKESVGYIFTSNYLTLKYKTDGWGLEDNGFQLVITAVKEPKHYCKNYRCLSKEFCISPDLVCDSVNHCGDNSDESICTKASNEVKIFGLELNFFIVVSALTLLLIIVVMISCVWIGFCKRTSNRNISVSNLQSMETNGSKHLNYYRPAVLNYLHILQKLMDPSHLYYTISI